jgi:hypothetical protein
MEAPQPNKMPPEPSKDVPKRTPKPVPVIPPPPQEKIDKWYREQDPTKYPLRLAWIGIKLWCCAGESMAAHIIVENGGLRSPGRFELSWKRWGAALELIFDHDAEYGYPWMLHLHFLLVNIFLHFPLAWVPSSKREPWMREWQRFGFSWTDDALHFHWNEMSKVWWIPWLNKVHQRHEVRRVDGSWVPFVGSWEQKESDGREEFTLPYCYILRNGTPQHRTATVFVERRAWRPKWFQWSSIFEKSRQSIDVCFDDEVGERSGSWKGGCVGCGWEMLPGETAEQTLRRMERERKFN